MRFSVKPRWQGRRRGFVMSGPGDAIGPILWRLHGTDYGRVFMGIQVLLQERKRFTLFLDQWGYQYWDESEHSAYRLFPGG